MPSDKTGDGKRKLPDPPEAMVTPDKKVPVPTGSSGSSTRRILFSERHYQKSQLGSGEMEEVQSRSRFCPQQEVMSGECAAPASVTHRKGIASRTLFGKFPSREQMGQFFESTEQQVSWITDEHNWPGQGVVAVAVRVHWGTRL